MKTKKLAILFAISMSGMAFSQQMGQMGGPLPEYTGAQNYGMQPNSMTAPGNFQGQPQQQVGEQPSYVQTGTQNCYDRNYRSNIVGPVQANGQPVPMPGQNTHGM